MNYLKKSCKYLIYLLPLALLLSCASWNPRMGMTVKDFDRMCGMSFNGSSVIESAKGATEVRSCRAKEGTLYTFTNGNLVSIERGATTRTFSPTVTYSTNPFETDSSSSVRKINRDLLIQNQQRNFEKIEQDSLIRRQELQNWKPGQSK